MRILGKAVVIAGYKVEKEGVLIEQFDVVKANEALSITQKQVLVTPIQTERYLISLQDHKFGPISLNGQELFRVMLYDVGTKLHLEGTAGILINSDMNLSSENFIAYLNVGMVRVTAVNI